jgi:hypothetical protein
LADFDGPARTLRPIGESTVCGPLTWLREVVVVVVDLEVLVVGLLVVVPAVVAVAFPPITLHALASNARIDSPKPAETGHDRLIVLPAGLFLRRTSMPGC